MPTLQGTVRPETLGSIREKLDELAEEARKTRHHRIDDHKLLVDTARNVNMVFDFTLKIWKAVDPNQRPAESPLVDALEGILARLNGIEQTLHVLAEQGRK